MTGESDATFSSVQANAPLPPDALRTHTRRQLPPLDPNRNDEQPISDSIPHDKTRILLPPASVTDSTHDRLDERLRTIEARTWALSAQADTVQSQLIATQEMIQNLMCAVGRLERAVGALPAGVHVAAGPNVSLVPTSVTTQPAEPAQPTQAATVVGLTEATDEAKPKRPAVLHRRMSPMVIEAMTRTFSISRVLGGENANGSAFSPPTLASAVSAVRRLTRGGSSIAPRDLDSTKIARHSSTSLPHPNINKPEIAMPTPMQRSSSWPLKLFSIPRVHPTTATTQLMAARMDGSQVHPLTLRHSSNGRFAWDVLVMILVLIDVIVTPLSLSFNYQFPVFPAINDSTTIVFGVDLLVRALSSYTTKRGVLVSGPRKTIPHYFFSLWAVADFLSFFPFEYFASSGRFLSIAKVIRLAKISQLLQRFHSARKAGVLRLFRLIGIVLLVSHLLACYWNWVAQVWRVQEDGYLEKSMFHQYIHSWTIVIGSLNASPPVMHTPSEEVSVALFMLIGNVLQASVFGSVAALIQSFDEEEVAYNKKLITTYERCKLLDIPEPLAERITRYYEHLYRETRSVDPDADAFINELSPALICEVKFQLYREMVRQIPFFASASINPVLIEALILRLRTVIYMQDDMLFRKGEFGDWMGFLGSKGSVGVLGDRADALVRILRKGDYFGETGLLHRVKRVTTAVALTWVQVHVLSRGDLDFVKEQYAEDVETLEHEIQKYMKSRVARQMQKHHR